MSGQPTVQSSEWLSADRPIQTREDDALGRRLFSESLAAAIGAWSGKDSLVLALYGEWGNGKSSIKNMVVESLKDRSPAIKCVDFNPWQLANRPNLSEAFFDELGIALKKGRVASRGETKAILNKYRRWAHRLQGSRDLARTTRNLFGQLLLFFGGVTLYSALIHSTTLTLVAALVFILFGILGLTTEILNAFIKFREAGTVVGEKSIGEVKDELAEELKRLKSPILVILDDLDRLTPQELLEVFQLVKANGDFPNLIYLTLCDRIIVEENIEQLLKVSGRDYLEKIIQVAFDIPLIDTGRVRQVLFNRLNSILSAEGVSNRFSEKRWANVFWSGLHSYFITLRDVNRFISTLAFQVSALSVDGSFEVNPIDLICLETIRLFEPEVYNAIRSSKEVLTSNKPEGREAATVKSALNSIVELGSEAHREDLKEVIKLLFPTIEWAFDGPNYAAAYGQEWYRDLRVCAVKMFDRYFRLAISDRELSQAEIQRLLASRKDRNELRTQLWLLDSRGLLELAIEELGVHEDDLNPEAIEPYITAIIDIGDSLSDEDRGMFEVPVQWKVGFRIQKPLEKLDNGSRFYTFANAIKNTDGLAIAIEVVAVLTASQDRRLEESLFSEEQSLNLKKLAVSKIEEAASSSALLKSSKLAMLLGVWRDWGNIDDPKTFVDRETNNPEVALQLLKSLVLRSMSQQWSDRVQTARYYIRCSDVEQIIAMDTLNERIKPLVGTELDDEGRRAITCFFKAIIRRDEGKPDEGPFVTD